MRGAKAITRKPYIQNKKLWEDPADLVDDELATELLGNGGHKKIEGKTAKEKIKNAGKLYTPKPTVTLEEYCNLVFNWLLINPRVFSVLEYYEDESNQPFDYPMEIVEQNEKIQHLLEQRIVNLCLTGNIKYGFGTAVMANQFGWVTSRTSTDKPTDAPTDDKTDIKYQFGQ